MDESQTPGTPVPPIAPPAPVTAPVVVPAPAPVAAAQPTLPGVLPPPAATPAPVAGAAPAGAPRVYTADEIVKRVDREVSHRVKKLLGMDLETAVSRLRAADELQRLANDGTEKGQQLTSMIEQLRSENASLRSQLADAESRVTKVKARSSEDKLVAAIKTAAARSGILSDKEEYAIYEYRQAVKRQLAMKQPPSPPHVFFASMKTSHPFLFQDGQAPVVIAPSTAGPESTPGSNPPVPARTDLAPETPNAEKMNDRQFADYTKSRYGVSFGS